MKTNLTLFVVMHAALTIAAFAGESPKLSPLRVTEMTRRFFSYQPQLSTPAGLSDSVTAPDFSLRQITPLKDGVVFTNQTVRSGTEVATSQSLRHLGAIPAKTAEPRIVFSIPSSPTFAFDEHSTATWYPAVSFRF